MPALVSKTKSLTPAQTCGGSNFATIVAAFTPQTLPLPNGTSDHGHGSDDLVLNPIRVETVSRLDKRIVAFTQVSLTTALRRDVLVTPVNGNCVQDAAPTRLRKSRK